MAWLFKFTPEAQLQWHWVHVDDDTSLVLRKSGGSFSSLYACVNDAGMMGFEGAFPEPSSSRRSA